MENVAGNMQLVRVKGQAGNAENKDVNNLPKLALNWYLLLDRDERS